MVKQIVAPRTRLEEARRRLGLSQLKLAAASNFGSASEISRFETGYGKPYPKVPTRRRWPLSAGRGRTSPSPPAIYS
jgi:predicted transcriptional regulator